MTMKIELSQEHTFSARAGQQLVHGLRISSEWEGLRKLVDGTGRHMIVDADGIVVKGTAALLRELHLPRADDGFIAFPQTTLPGGRIVPAFTVAARPCSTAADGAPVVDGKAAPRVSISYGDTVKWLATAGLKILTASQSLALALDIAAQDINWTGGEVGAGAIYQGIHRGRVNGPQDAAYEPDETERRWHQLSTGDRIWDFAGNVYSWLFDDLHGDDEGLVKGVIPADSPLLTSAPAPSGQKGVGYVPTGPLKWSGHALIRGGYWCSYDDAGVFCLDVVWADYGDGNVGVRCTK